MKKLMFCIITAFALMLSAPMAMAMPVDSGVADTVGSYPLDGFYGNTVAVDVTDKKTQSTDNDIFAWSCCGSGKVPGGGNSSMIGYQSSDSKVTRNVTVSHEGPGYAGVVAA